MDLQAGLRSGSRCGIPGKMDWVGAEHTKPRITAADSLTRTSLWSAAALAAWTINRSDISRSALKYTPRNGRTQAPVYTHLRTFERPYVRTA